MSTIAYLITGLAFFIILPYFGFCAHEILHYYAVSRWQENVAIHFEYGYPMHVDAGPVEEMPPRRIRIWAGCLLLSLVHS